MYLTFECFPQLIVPMRTTSYQKRQSYQSLGRRTAFLYAHKALTRGQDTREATLKMMFEDTLPGVGPDTAVHIGFVSNEGKAILVSFLWAWLLFIRGKL